MVNPIPWSLKKKIKTPQSKLKGIVATQSLDGIWWEANQFRGSVANNKQQIYPLHAKSSTLGNWYRTCSWEVPWYERRSGKNLDT